MTSSRSLLLLLSTKLFFLRSDSDSESSVQCDVGCLLDSTSCSRKLPRCKSFTLLVEKKTNHKPACKCSSSEQELVLEASESESVSLCRSVGCGSVYCLKSRTRLSECGYSNLLVALWNPQVVFGLAWALFLCVFISMVFFPPRVQTLAGWGEVNRSLYIDRRCEWIFVCVHWSSDTPPCLSSCQLIGSSSG